MIVTFTANPSLDRTARLEGGLARGGVNRLGEVSAEAGGKGVNVARAVHLAGRPGLAVLPADDYDPVIQGLRALGVAHRGVSTGQPVRANLTLVEADGTTTKLNEPGSPLDEERQVALRNVLLASAHQARWVALCGSLPPGAPTDWYADLVRHLRPLGVRIAVDTSDAPLMALARHLPEAAPDLVKPNSEELGQITGTDGLELERQAAEGNWSPVLEAARQLTARGIGQVLVTLGGSGALLVTEEGAWHAAAPSITVASTVGAGDSSLAGYLMADCDDLPPEERLRRAVAWGSGAAALPGSQLPGPSQAPVDQVHVTRID
ncbi:hexose kinase [Luteococcus sediminum]